ncbi:uncharacterized protein LOC115446078 isoform X2 [Manduca sexta]|uniref:uncharacterized protein LOC115446078 isoform X2 n=1 Tax=Manduca sexta TaxID=7130 RepID=UPI00188EE1BE|nr:uncharacterized protein LOC115446078 isoform X2 [Manduca sexta]
MISDFAKEKVFWTRKMNLKLVKFIESRPNIWNPKHPKYTSVSLRDQTYAEFASEYGNEFTWQAVKDRWTNIRSTFANYLRKINHSRQKGDAEETTDRKEEISDEEFSDDNSNSLNSSCVNVAKNLASVFRGVQNDAFGLNNSKTGHVGQVVAKKLSQMNSYEAAQVSHKITEILLLYEKDNPVNPNNLKNEYS